MDLSKEEQYVLSADEHKKIRQLIRRNRVFELGSEEREKPRAIILAGQPGAGKSGLRIAAENDLISDGGAVVVDTDELRADYTIKIENTRYSYDDLQKEDDRIAANLVKRMRDSGPTN